MRLSVNSPCLLLTRKNEMKQYLDLERRILTEGTRKEDRTGTGTISIFGHQMRFDLSEGFPLVTTKKMFTRGIIEELLWFISGDTNKKTLQAKNVHIWDEWGDDETPNLSLIKFSSMYCSSVGLGRFLLPVLPLLATKPFLLSILDIRYSLISNPSPRSSRRIRILP